MTDPDLEIGSPPIPTSAATLFGDRAELAQSYATLLASEGVEHGHIGPREVPRIWSRHLENSALVSGLIPDGVTVLDVGSGAGLPGIPLAIRRPDLRLTLLEPMQRRCVFLARAISVLELNDQIEVVRGRAEDGAIRSRLGARDWIVARAVAPLDRLIDWCLPLLAQRGRLLAMKGESALTEVEACREMVTQRSGGPPTVVELGGAQSADRTWVVSVQRQTTGGRARRRVR